MNCWHCDTELIWGGDHDTEDNEDYDIVSNLSCPEWHSFVEVYHGSYIHPQTHFPQLNIFL